MDLLITVLLNSSSACSRTVRYLLFCLFSSILGNIALANDTLAIRAFYVENYSYGSLDADIGSGYALPPTNFAWGKNKTTHTIMFGGSGDAGMFSQTSPYWGPVVGTGDSLSLFYGNTGQPFWRGWRDSTHANGGYLIQSFNAVNSTNFDFVAGDSVRTEMFWRAFIMWAIRNEVDGADLDAESSTQSSANRTRFFRIGRRLGYNATWQSYIASTGKPGFRRAGKMIIGNALFMMSTDWMSSSADSAIDFFDLQAYNYQNMWGGSGNKPWYQTPWGVPAGQACGTCEAQGLNYGYTSHRNLIQEWVDAGWTRSKIVVGFDPGAVTVYTGTTALGTGTPTGNEVDWARQDFEGLLSHGGTRTYNTTAMAPYISGTATGGGLSGQFVGSYTDSISLKAICDALYQVGAGGIMVYAVAKDVATLGSGANHTLDYYRTPTVSAGSYRAWQLNGGAPPPPPSAPTATTGAASAITQTSATLNGSVSTNGASTTVRFVWGIVSGVYTDSALAAESPIPSGSSGVSLAVSGWTAGTNYYYRLRAYNVSGGSQGSEAICTTSPAPISPTATTSSASSITQTTATVNGTVNANGASTTVRFVYGTVSGVYTDSLTATQSPVSGTGNTAVSRGLTGLSMGTTYYVRVRAYNSAGNSQGSEASFTTNAAVPTSTTTAISSITQTTATLNGTVSANGASTTVRFVYGTVSGVYTDSLTATQSPVSGTTNTAVSGNVTGLSVGTTYYVRVRAYNSAGNSQGSQVSFTTGAAPPTATTTAATSITPTTAAVNGTVNANGASTTVRFIYGTVPGVYTDSLTATQSPVSGTTNTTVSGNVTGLGIGTTYYVRVRAYNSAGNSQGSEVSFTTSAAAPTSTTTAASSITQTTAALNGTVNANGATTTVRFVYGTVSGVYTDSLAAVQSPVSGTTTTPVSGDIIGLAVGTTYYVRVRAYNSAGNTQGSQVSFTTSAAAPTATTSGATSITPTTATVNGTVNANGASTIVRFVYGTVSGVYTDSLTAAQSPVLGTINITVSGNVTSLAIGTTYYVRVRAYNSAGNFQGNEVSFTTGAAAPTATTAAASSITSTAATLNGTVNANGASATVRFVYGTVSGVFTDSLTAAQSPVSGTTNTAVSGDVTGLSPGITYYVRLRVYNSAGNTQGSQVSFTAGAAAPAATSTAATSITQTTATVNGTVNANGASTTVRFVYGTVSGVYTDSTTAIQSPVTGTTTTAVSRGLTGLATGTTYYVRVRAYNTAGNAQGSEISFATSAAAPTATTTAVTSITPTSATFNGTVNANGASTTVRFVYGTVSGAYTDSVTAIQSPVSGTTSTPVSATIAGLSFGTTYFVRVRAYNSVGAVQGSEISFATSAAAPSATTTAASSITQTTATLNGTVNAHGASTTVRLLWGTVSGAYSDSALALESPVTGGSITTVSFAATALSAATTYYYRVRASNTAGSNDGNEMQFITLLPGGQGTQDITAQGNAVALVTNPTGSGNHNIEVTRDGVTPPVGNTDPMMQYDTYTGGSPRPFDWIGFQFSSTRWFAGIVYQEGLDNASGGCFTTLQVQVRSGGVWTDVQNLVSNPPYTGNNSISYEMFELSFSPVSGDAIRIAGAPTGSAHYVGVGELRVFESGPPPASPNLTSPANAATNQPTTVTMRWRSIQSATSCQVQVARDSLFSTMVLNDSTVTDTTRQIGSLLFLTKYYWRVRAHNGSGYGAFSNTWTFTTRTQTDVGEQPITPADFSLGQNYPNPFNPTTTIRYGLTRTSAVTLTVCNTLGQEVAELVNERQEEGYHEAIFHADGLASGIYFYRLQAGDFVQTKKLLLLK